eukprot:13223-Heterococcus_DN1.PRE.2
MNRERSHNSIGRTATKLCCGCRCLYWSTCAEVPCVADCCNVPAAIADSYQCAMLLEAHCRADLYHHGVY